MITYALPLFMLTLYYNYGYDYGLTGLHLVYPLIGLLPYLLTGQKSREMLDLSQLLTMFSVVILTVRHATFYALSGWAVQAIVYFYNHIRGIRYRSFNSVHFYDVAMIICSYLMYVALLQSCMDAQGNIDCARARLKMKNSGHCAPQRRPWYSYSYMSH